MKYVFGIDIGGTTIKCGLFEESGNLIEKWEVKTDRSNKGANVPQDVADTIKSKMAERGIALCDVLGTGIGVPGPIKTDGTVLTCANLGWGKFNVNEKMSSLLNMPVKAGNDANVAALGEMWKGGGEGFSNVVLVTLGTGVGGGVIVDGKIVAGSNGAGGELGHMIVDPEETRICGCGGHGHLEQYASATGIAYLATEAAKENGAETELSKLETITAKDVFDLAKQGDSVAASIVEKVCKILAGALTHVAAVVDPEAFVIGGGVSKAGEILTTTIEKYYNDNLLSALMGKQFRLAKLGNDAGIFGCAKMILDLGK